MSVVSKPCENCGCPIFKDPDWGSVNFARRRFCSRECAGRSRVNKRTMLAAAKATPAPGGMNHEKAAHAHGNLMLWRRTACEFKRWWLERFTMHEIRQIYSAFSDDRVPLRPPPGTEVKCARPGCGERFVITSDQPRRAFCSDFCRKKLNGKTWRSRHGR